MRVHLASKSPTGPRAIIAIITARLSQSGERMGQLGLMGGRKSGLHFEKSALDDGASGRTPAVARRSLARRFYKHVNASNTRRLRADVTGRMLRSEDVDTRKRAQVRQGRVRCGGKRRKVA